MDGVTVMVRSVILISTDRRLIYRTGLGLKNAFVIYDDCLRKYDLLHVLKRMYFNNFPQSL